jgi:hypothetical protein
MNEIYSLDPRDQPFADDVEDVDPDDESWRDEPEPEQDEEAASRRAEWAEAMRASDAGAWEEA